MREVGDVVGPVVSAICVAGLIVLLAWGALVVLSWLPPGSVHL
jgi:hypothetical protein